MSYNDTIKKLELELERIKNSDPENGTKDPKYIELLVRLREVRRLQYESQFVMNTDEYDY